jgi:hypothetical protein
LIPRALPTGGFYFVLGFCFFYAFLLDFKSLNANLKILFSAHGICSTPAGLWGIIRANLEQHVIVTHCMLGVEGKADCLRTGTV